MVELHCKCGAGHEKVCTSCEELVEYINEQIDRCPYGSEKCLCRSCQTSCFSEDMKMRFHQAIRGSNLRMMLVNPYLMLKLSLIDMRDARQKRK